MNQLVSYQLSGRVAKIGIDDGKLNVMNAALLGAIHAALDSAERDKALVLLSGRPGIFSAGYDLKVFSHGDAAAVHTMLRLGGELITRVLSFPTPVVTVCTGHAFPAGAFLMLAADLRLAADGPYQIGLNEVAIGLSLPAFAVEIARQRLTPAYFNRATLTGQLFSPSEAREAGFVNRVVAPAELAQVADATATALSQINFEAHAATKLKVRAAAIVAMHNAMQEITLAGAERSVGRRTPTR